MSSYHAHNPAAVADAARKLNEEAAARFSDPQWRAEKAADMTSTIYEDFQYENFLPMLGAIEYLGTGDRSFVKEVKGLEVFWVARGGYIEQSTVNTSVVEIPRDTVGFHVSELEEKMETGFAEASSTMVGLGTERLGAAVNSRGKALLDASRDGTNSISASGALGTVDNINAALRTVKDQSKSRNVTIIGRATAVETLMDTLLGSLGNGSGFLPESNEEMVRQGKLGSYRGTPIVEIPNFEDGSGTSYWPSDELYVIADDAAKFAFFGGLKSREYLEQDNWYWHYLAKQEFGGLVNHPERAYLITDTDL